MTEHTLEQRADKYDGQPVYAVMVGGVEVGRVEGYHPTFDRKPRGSRIVTKRWKSKKRYWIAEYPGCRNAYRLPYETRKRAVETILRHSPKVLPVGEWMDSPGYKVALPEDTRVMVRRQDGEERRGRLRDYDFSEENKGTDITEWMILEDHK